LPLTSPIPSNLLLNIILSLIITFFFGSSAEYPKGRLRALWEETQQFSGDWKNRTLSFLHAYPVKLGTSLAGIQ
jgi:hypothetical protein